MKYKHVHTKIFIQIHTNQSVAINLLKLLIFNLVKSQIIHISHFANNSIFSSETIVCRSLSKRGGRITF